VRIDPNPRHTMSKKEWEEYRLGLPYRSTRRDGGAAAADFWAVHRWENRGLVRPGPARAAADGVGGSVAPGPRSGCTRPCLSGRRWNGWSSAPRTPPAASTSSGSGRTGPGGGDAGDVPPVAAPRRQPRESLHRGCWCRPSSYPGSSSRAGSGCLFVFVVVVVAVKGRGFEFNHNPIQC
jgi:hypothetical protein